MKKPASQQSILLSSTAPDAEDERHFNWCAAPSTGGYNCCLVDECAQVNKARRLWSLFEMCLLFGTEP